MKKIDPKDINMTDQQMAAAMLMLMRRMSGDEIPVRFASPTLVDVAVHNANDGVVELIDEVIQEHPELALVPARTIRGINYKTLVLTTLPATAFRDANEGTAATLAVYENRLVETFIMSPKWVCDKAIADRAEDGPEAYIALAASAMLESAAQHLATQFYYGLTQAAASPRHGTLGDAKGFPGLHDALGLVAADNQLVDALETAGGNIASSAWMIKVGPTDVNWVWGNNGALEVSDVRIESVLDSGGTNSFTAYVQELLAYPGLQIGNRFCVGRVGELGPTVAAKAAELNDDFLASLWAKFPTAKKPDMILMSRRSQKELQDSRTATNATGVPAPFPTMWESLPIHVTDAISETEVVDLIT